MPLDVLKQLKEASNNLQNEQLKTSIDNVISSAQQSETSLEALRSIMSALTEGGVSLSNSLEKVVFYFEKFEERSNAAKNAMYGFGNSLQAINVKELNKVNDVLLRIQNQQKALSQQINFFPNLDKTLKSLGSISKELQNIRKIASQGVDINVNYSGTPKIQNTIIKKQAFSNGGQIQYTESNSRKAQKGGQFSGKRHGDKEIVFVNGGQAIITERAIKSGARQAGMGIGQYVNSLNTANLSRLKKGRSFASGGSVGGSGIDQQIENLKSKVSQGRVSTNKDYSQRKDYKKSLDDILKALEAQSKIDEHTANVIKDAMKNDDKKAIGMIEEILKINGNISLKELKDCPEIIEQISEAMEELQDAFDGAEKKIKTFGDLMQANADDAVKSIDKTIERWGNFGNLVKNSENKALSWGASFVAAAQQMSGAINNAAKFYKQQANINANFSKFQSSVKSFGNVAEGAFKRFQNTMNLTRAQASQLVDTFTSVGVQGNISFSQIEQIAAGIKEQFGKLDTSMLKEAINLVKDLPQEQIQVMITGHGKFDDKTNLMANLMKKGNIDVAAKLITQGAFGQVEGVTPQMSEADKRTIELQTKIEKFTDDIHKNISHYTPSMLKRTDLILSAVGTMAGSNGLKDLYKIGKSIHGFGLKIGDILGKGAGKAAGGVGGVGATGAAGGAGMAGMAGGMVAVAAVTAISSGLWALSDYVKEISENIKKQQRRERTNNIKQNQMKYGMSVMNHEMDTSTNFGHTLGSHVLKGSGIGVAAGGAIGGVLGSIVPGLGTAVGIAVGSAVGGVLGAAVGTITGTIDGVIDAIANSKQDRQWNRIAKAGQEAIKAYEKNQDILKSMNEKVGIQTVDTRKQILHLSKMNKVLKMIKDGSFVAMEDSNVQAAANRNKMITEIGGTDASYSFNLDQQMYNATQSFSKTMSKLQQLKLETKTSDKYDDTGRITAMNSIVEEQVNAMQKLTKALQDSVGKYEQIPSVIQATLSSSLLNALNGFKKRNLLGSNVGASISASVVAKNETDAINAASQRFSKDQNRINEFIGDLKERIKENNIANSDTAKSFGGKSQVDSNGNIIEEVQKQNLDRANTIVNEYNSKKTKAIANDSVAKKVDNISQHVKASSQSLNQNTSKFQDKKVYEDNFKDISETEQASVKKNVFYDNMDEIVTQLKEAKNATNDENQKKEIQKRIEDIGAIRTKIKEIDLSEEGSFTNFEKIVMELKTAISHGQQNLDGIIYERLKENKDIKEIEKKYGDGNVGNALQYISRHVLGNTMTKTNIASQKAANQTTINYIKTIEDSVKRFQDAMDLIYNSAEVLYHKTQSEIMEKSLSYDSLSKGGAAAADLSQAQLQTLASRKQSLNIAQEEVAGFKSQADKWWDENKGKIDDKTLNTYGDLKKQLIDAQSKALREGATSQDKAKVQIAFDRLKEFERENAKLLEEYKQNNNKNLIDIQANLGKAQSTLITHAQKMAQFKKDYIAITSSLIKNIQEASNKESFLAASQAELSSSKGKLSSQNVDFSGMQQSLNQVSQYALKEAKESVRAKEEATRSIISSINQQLATVQKGSAEQAALLARRNQVIAALNKAKVDAQVKAVEQIQSTAQEMRDAVARREQSLSIQKDLLTSIGAPFEMILDIERNVVAQARAKAQIQQQTLDNMIANGASAKQVEMQKLKTMRAQAEVVKATYGAQRDAIDKFLGKIMGGFEQVGGIFGPDSDVMNARIYGQGYSTDPSGMIHVNNNVMGYKERVFGNAIAGDGRNTERMLNRDSFGAIGAVSEQSNSNGEQVNDIKNNSRNDGNSSYSQNGSSVVGGGVARDSDQVIENLKLKIGSSGGNSVQNDKISVLISIYQMVRDIYNLLNDKINAINKNDKNGKNGKNGKNDKDGKDGKDGKNDKNGKNDKVDKKINDKGTPGVQQEPDLKLDSNTTFHFFGKSGKNRKQMSQEEMDKRKVALYKKYGIETVGDVFDPSIKRYRDSILSSRKKGKNETVSDIQEYNVSSELLINITKDVAEILEILKRGITLKNAKDVGTPFQKASSKSGLIKPAQLMTMQQILKSKNITKWSRFNYKALFDKGFKNLQGWFKQFRENIAIKRQQKSLSKPSNQITKKPDNFARRTAGWVQNWLTKRASAKYSDMDYANLSQQREKISKTIVSKPKGVLGRVKNWQAKQELKAVDYAMDNWRKKHTPPTLRLRIPDSSKGTIPTPKSQIAKKPGSSKGITPKTSSQIAKKPGSSNGTTLKLPAPQDSIPKTPTSNVVGKSPNSTQQGWDKGKISKYLGAKAKTVKGSNASAGEIKSAEKIMANMKAKYGTLPEGIDKLDPKSYSESQIDDAIKNQSKGGAKKSSAGKSPKKSNQIGKKPGITFQLSAPKDSVPKSSSQIGKKSGITLQLPAPKSQTAKEQDSSQGKVKKQRNEDRQRKIDKYRRGTNIVNSLSMGASAVKGIYDTFNQFQNAQTANDYLNASSTAMQSASSLLFAGTSMARSGKPITNTMGKAGAALSLFSSVPQILQTKDDGNGGKVWDGNAASYGMQNMANNALLFTPLGSKFAKKFAKGENFKKPGLAMLAQLGGQGVSYLANKTMKDGSAKNRVTAAGDIASSIGGTVGDVSLTMATGGVNKVVEGSFDVGRKLFTEQGQRRAKNVGISNEIYDTLTKVTMAQTVFKAAGSLWDLAEGGTRGRDYVDVGAALQEIDSAQDYTKNTNKKMAAGVWDRMSDSDKKRYESLSLQKEKIVKDSSTLTGGLVSIFSKEAKVNRSERLNYFDKKMTDIVKKYEKQAKKDKGNLVQAGQSAIDEVTKLKENFELQKDDTYLASAEYSNSDSVKKQAKDLKATNDQIANLEKEPKTKENEEKLKKLKEERDKKRKGLRTSIEKDEKNGNVAGRMIRAYSDFQFGDAGQDAAEVAKAEKDLKKYNDKLKEMDALNFDKNDKGYQDTLKMYNKTQQRYKQIITQQQQRRKQRNDFQQNMKKSVKSPIDVEGLNKAMLKALNQQENSNNNKMKEITKKAAARQKGDVKLTQNAEGKQLGLTEEEWQEYSGLKQRNKKLRTTRQNIRLTGVDKKVLQEQKKKESKELNSKYENVKKQRSNDAQKYKSLTSEQNQLKTKLKVLKDSGAVKSQIDDVQKKLKTVQDNKEQAKTVLDKHDKTIADIKREGEEKGYFKEEEIKQPSQKQLKYDQTKKRIEDNQEKLTNLQTEEDEWKKRKKDKKIKDEGLYEKNMTRIKKEKMGLQKQIKEDEGFVSKYEEEMKTQETQPTSQSVVNNNQNRNPDPNDIGLHTYTSSNNIPAVNAGSGRLEATVQGIFNLLQSMRQTPLLPTISFGVGTSDNTNSNTNSNSDSSTKRNNQSSSNGGIINNNKGEIKVKVQLALTNGLDKFIEQKAASIVSMGLSQLGKQLP